jgi:nitrate/TMAO reductase-like tetraheme cytochrome c subunit
MLLRNPVSLAGVALGIVSLANIFLFVLLDLIAARPSPYIGILAYMVAPAFFGFSLLLMLVGVLVERRKKVVASEFYPRIDLNDVAQRSAVISFVTFLVVFVMISAAGSYKAYEYTDSVQFCGQLCHTAMNPEFTAYQVSPHARVACVECHVGSGAGSYVKAKWSGTRQAYAAILNTFPRPIPTPVHNLRPAEDTCEQCHWPKKFYGGQLKVFTHYGNDEGNTVRQIRMILKTGGGDPATGAPEGIHWHMNLGNRIEYVAADEKRQIIPYIHVEDLQGRVTEYYAKDSTLSKDQISKAQRHHMDCVDCHNRPTHEFDLPENAVDKQMSLGHISPELPFIRKKAVEVLKVNYPTRDVARQNITAELNNFYRTNYPQIYQTRGTLVRQAGDEIAAIYLRNIFPDMHVTWGVHPSNLGHNDSPGCFRCHDGSHTSADGQTITNDCSACHQLLASGEENPKVLTDLGMK